MVLFGLPKQWGWLQQDMNQPLLRKNPKLGRMEYELFNSTCQGYILLTIIVQLLLIEAFTQKPFRIVETDATGVTP